MANSHKEFFNDFSERSANLNEFCSNAITSCYMLDEFGEVITTPYITIGNKAEKFNLVAASNIAEGYNLNFYYTCKNGPQEISSVLLNAK